MSRASPATPAVCLPGFDTLLHLARHDPAALENLRLTLCETVIHRASAPARRRLRALFWRIDRERERATNPMAACLWLQGQLLASLYRLDAALNHPAPACAPTARLLAFPLHGHPPA